MREGLVRQLESAGSMPRLDLSGGHLAARYPGLLTRKESAEYAAAVLRAREEWTPNFGGAQFTLGRAWYTHLEVDREEEYFARVRDSDAAVEKWAPGLQERLIETAAAILRGPVVRRERWCGPGVHIFTRGGVVARKGGDLHFDTEGLAERQLSRRASAYSFVLMLQPAESGGGLRIWDRLYEGEDFPENPGPRVANVLIRYEPGELVVFDSYRMHQIQPFGGEVDRLSATMHVVEEDGTWEAWF
jgi:hypothetical protein